MRFFVLFLLLLISGCQSQSNNHYSILGTTYGWNIQDHGIEVLLDAQIDKLNVRHVRMNNLECLSGFAEHLEIAGEIGPDSTAAIERLLPKLHRCERADGNWVVNIAYLSSGGGYLKDGYALGELFRQYQIKTVITGGQQCASSCAIAFLGGKFRRMEHNAQLLFHAPYRSNGIAIDCSDRGQVAGLEAYYKAFLGDKDGAFLLERTMSYCSASSGWILNADGAKLFGITTD